MAYRLRATLRRRQPVISAWSDNWKILTAWARARAWAWAWGTEVAAAEIRSPRSRCPAQVVYTEGAGASTEEEVASTEGAVFTEGIARYWAVGPFQAARSEPVPYP